MRKNLVALALATTLLAPTAVLFADDNGSSAIGTPSTNTQTQGKKKHHGHHKHAKKTQATQPASAAGSGTVNTPPAQ